ncbi:hypothetical protein QWY75_05870 [Pontixanthobacter aestiaquae]|uniref:Lipoprotein n=1 Tax=Pontixanthobacter aestiaquae TaxID=1509367 RepID=A0A844Z8K1_9SPHN|nr:hypothetical protein [Pontixanthobacter aestiaquae]MDN3645731.1 hypothetical protein [Pontixanthobacter aestiaquae]MXO83273.1 hypothetical protein [Pontixanthobacter aestiaquae]
MKFPPIRRISATLLAAFSAAMLTGCFMIPGNFDAKLDLRSDGTFTYSYNGEIRFLGMSELAQRSRGRNEVSEWDPGSQTCWGTVSTEATDAEIETAAVEAVAEEADVAEAAAEGTIVPVTIEDSYDDRECTEEELAERRKEFDERQERSRERQEREAKQMQAVFGGIDPSDPSAGKQISERLERQRGWNSVEYLGEGLFKVDFSITSRIDHDFTFPTMEGMSAGQPFLYAFRRDGDTVRIEAPGFTRGGSSGALGGGSMNWLMLAGMERGSRSGDPDLSELLKNTNGTFTITTDGEILANNTDAGYSDTAAGRTLVWKISSDSMDSAAPMALVKLAQ